LYSAYIWGPYHKDTKKYKEQMEGKNNGTERTNWQVWKEQSGTWCY
jgi:hypothetical protein